MTEEDYLTITRLPMDTNFLTPQLSLQESFVFEGTGNVIFQDLNQLLTFVPITIPDSFEQDEALQASLQAITETKNDNNLLTIEQTSPQSEQSGEKKDNNNDDRATVTNTGTDEQSTSPIQLSFQTVDLLGDDNTIQQESQQLVADLFFFEEERSDLGDFFESVAQDLLLSSLQFAFQDIIIEGDDNFIEQSINQTITAFVFLDEEEIINNTNFTQVSIPEIFLGDGTTVVDDNLISQDTTQSIALNLNFSDEPIISNNGEGQIDVLSDFPIDTLINEIISEEILEIATQTSFQDAFITGDNNFIIQEEIQELLPNVFSEEIASKLTDATKDAKIQTLVKNSVENVINSEDDNVFGQTEVFLEGRREQVRTEETNLGNLTADANLAAAQSVDESVRVSLINSGGIRTAIGEVDDHGQLLPPPRNLETGKEEGQISQFNIVNSLRFNNDLTLLTVTAQELELLLEHSVAATKEGATPSQFPQVSGLSFSFDPSQPAIAFDEQANILTEGERIQSLSILNADGSVHDVIVEEGNLIGDPSREIRLVTLDFLSGTFSDSDFIGGEGYPFPAFAEDVVNLSEVLTDQGQATFADPGSEHDALAEFLVENFPIGGNVAFNQAETPPTKDERIINLSVQNNEFHRPDSPVLKEPGIFDLTNEEVFGPAGEVVTAHLASEVISRGVFNNLVGFYTVADKAGGIDTDDDGIADLTPGEDGYTEAALANAEDAILKRGQTGSIELTSGEIVVPFLLARGGDLDEIPTELPEGIQAYFPYLAANTDGADHFRLLSDNTLGIEDLEGGGDQDFNDLIFQLDFA